MAWCTASWCTASLSVAALRAQAAMFRWHCSRSALRVAFCSADHLIGTSRSSIAFLYLRLARSCSPALKSSLPNALLSSQNARRRAPSISCGVSADATLSRRSRQRVTPSGASGSGSTGTGCSIPSTESAAAAASRQKRSATEPSFSPSSPRSSASACSVRP